MTRQLPALSTRGTTCSLSPARRICGSPGPYGNSLWRVPWFHENALLQVDARDDGRATTAPVALLARSEISSSGAALTCFGDATRMPAHRRVIGRVAIFACELGQRPR
jgi:hypothetical protein